MKVLHAITRLDRGGSSENTLLSAIGLAEKGYEVDLLFGQTQSPSIPLLEKARKAGVNFIEEDDLVRDIHPLRDLVAFIDIFRFIHNGKYDIVHAHSSKAGLICRLAARLAGVKTIIYTPHGHVFYGYFNKMFNRIIIFVESIVSHVTDKIVGLTPAECDEWIGFGIGKKEKYTAIPSGVDFDLMVDEISGERDIREELGIPPGKTIVGSVGRFVGVKGYEYLIKAAIEEIKKRNDIYFVLAGDGPLYQEYKEMISSEGAGERFHIIGWQENTGAVIKALDIFVLSSLNEGMGRVLAEAMFLEKPVIATRVGGVPSVVAGNAGLLVEPASSSAIERAIDVFMEDPAKARAMARKGREKALAEYSAEKMVHDLDMLYKKLTKET
ncbi:MAG: glycosyltransferase family 4 protein [Candidatus Omnitrophota bacterium]